MTPDTPPPGSYELCLSRPCSEGTHRVPAPRTAADFSSAPPDARKEALKRRVAEQLLAHHPTLQLFQFPYDKIAQFEKLSLEETRRKYRHLELNGPEDGNGVQVILWDDDASLTVPFWHQQEKAVEAFRELWSYLELVHRETSYVVHDPQLECTVDPSAGCEDPLANYLLTARRVREALPVGAASHERLQTPPAGDDRFPSIRQVATSEDMGTVLVAVGETGVVCGYAEVSLFGRCVNGTPSVPTAYLKSWYVTPEFRGRGIGQQLLEAAQQWAAARGFSELASEVELSNEQMIQAHLACGFTESRRAVHFIRPITLGLNARTRDQRPLAREEAPDPTARTSMAPTLPVPDSVAARP